MKEMNQRDASIEAQRLANLTNKTHRVIYVSNIGYEVVGEEFDVNRSDYMHGGMKMPFEYIGDFHPTIDLTPSWAGLVRGMLAVHASIQQSMATQGWHSPEQANNLKEIELQFRNMAIAADKWNEHCSQPS